jgi:hypothetical protein
MPWLTSVVVLVTVEGYVGNATALLHPAADGSISGNVRVNSDAIEPGKVISVSVWKEPHLFSNDPERRFFLHQSDGIAGFTKSSEVESSPPDANHAFQVKLGSITMSPPPLYGELSVTNGPGQDVSLALVDYSTNLEADWEYSVLEHEVRPLGGENTTVSIYRWSRSPAVQLSLMSSNGLSVGRGRLRRTGSVSISVKRESTVAVSVSQSAYIDAAEILFVDHTHHSPDPSSQFGSSETYHGQSHRSKYVLPVQFTGGSFTDLVQIEGENLVAELWGLLENANGDLVYYYLDGRACDVTASDASVTFD